MLRKFLPVSFITLLLALFLALGGHAVPAKKTPAVLKMDTSKITVKHFDANTLTKFRKDKDFNYNGEAVGEPTAWDRFWSWLWHTIGSLFRKVPYGGSILKYVLLGLAISLLAYIVFKSIGLDPIQLLRRESAKIAVPYTESLENIHEINFDNEIDKAVAQHNYRLAVRLLYLKCLKQLSDGNLIQWQIDKTNTAYFYELSNPEQKQTFGQLTRQFEYVWYGDFNIDKDTFSNINTLFQNFKKLIP